MENTQLGFYKYPTNVLIPPLLSESTDNWQQYWRKYQNWLLIWHSFLLVTQRIEFVFHFGYMDVGRK